MKQVKCLLGGKRVHVNRHTDRLREGVKPSWSSSSLIWGISSEFPLVSHIALPGSESVFCLSQGSPMSTHVHLLAKMDSNKEAYE